MSQEARYTQTTPFLSKFLTTRRNELHTWIAHTAIYAAYFTIVLFFLDALLKEVRDIKWYVLLLLSALPVFLQLTTWNYWTMGFKSRTQQFFVSILVLVAFYLIDPNKTLLAFWNTFIVHLTVFLIKRLIARNRHAPDTVAYGLTIFVVCVVYFGVTDYGQKNYPLANFLCLIIIFFRCLGISAIIPIFQDGVQLLVINNLLYRSVLMFGMLGIFAILPILQTRDHLRIISRTRKIDRSKSLRNTFQKLFARSCFYLLGSLLIVWHRGTVMSSLTALSIFILAAGPVLSLSRQKTHMERLLRWFGVNNLLAPTATDPTPSGWVNIRLDYFKKYIEQNRQYVSILFLVILSLVIVVLLDLFTDFMNSSGDLIALTLTIALSLGMIYLSIWFVRNRKKHIVMPFTVAEGQNEVQLQSLANLMTYAFVQELRYMALLLSLKQVETIASRNDNTLPIFATSGQEKSLIEQVRSLGNVEIANTKIPFGEFLGFLGNSAAHTRVMGTVVRQKDESIAVLVEFIQRGGQVVAVDIDFVPETSVLDLDEKIINGIARTLAVKLVLKLGNHPHLASSWKSLLNFLNGLDAAYHKDWWQAISFYRKSIQDEEASNGPAGPGYYHLGASLISQGNIIDGYTYLRIAEKKNAPQAEVQYMIALTLFYMFHDFLHIERSVFDDIRWRCELALERRPYFPEAHHLLGTIFYQRGKLRERIFTQVPMEPDEHYSKIELLPQDYPGDYKKAILHLSKAIKGYKRTLRFLPDDIVSQNTVFDERSKLVQYMMSATHRYGDAVRSLERYSEADSYYQRVLFAYPLNIRTLVDRAKTFCFSGNWQEADQFIRYNIFNNEDFRSNRSANFYMGWALAGGLINENTLDSKISNFLIRIYSEVGKKRREDHIKGDETTLDTDNAGAPHTRTRGRRATKLSSQESVDSKQAEDIKILGRSMLFLDYAIHQYPKYTHRWKQTNWFDDFEQAAKSLVDLKTVNPKELQDLLYAKPLDQNKIYHVGQIYYWLCWRAASSLPIREQNIDNTYRTKLGCTSVWSLKDHIPNQAFRNLYISLLVAKATYEKILESSDKHGVLCDLETRISKFKLGRRMYQAWNKDVACIEGVIKSLNDRPQGSITFSERWAVDLFAEFSMLTCHILTEANAFETAVLVGKQSASILKNWVSVWNKLMPSGFFFSSKIFDYQLASIQGWTAYAMYMGAHDVATTNRTMLLAPIINSQQNTDRPHNEETEINLILGLDLDSAQTVLYEALNLIPNHPLALFVKALVLEKQGNRSKAADELNRLLSQIAPFDPHVYSRRNSYIENIELPNRTVNRIKEADAHQYLVYKERSCGDLQFSNVMSISQIHVQLGIIANSLEDFRTSIGHMTLAFAETPYHDEQAEILLQLTEMLNRNGRFSNALAVLDETNLRRKHLSPMGSPNALSLKTVVMECILKTNLEKYRDALDRGNEISANWGIVDLSIGHDFLIEHFERGRVLYQDKSFRFLDYYDGNVLEQFRSMDEAAKFDGIVNDKKKLLNLIAALKKHTVYETINSISLEIDNENAGSPTSQEVIQANYDLVILTQALTELHKDIVLFIIQQCEWMNNCAFNYCELNFNIEKAEQYSLNAVELMTKLIPISDDLKISNLRVRLAQFYDTLAWVHYRKSGKGNLNKAFVFLNQHAMKYDQESPLIYYHLARIRLSQIESIWQESFSAGVKRTGISNHKSSVISNYLRDAFLYWRHAHRLDKEKNLYMRLRIVRLRIDQYRKNWEEINRPPAKEKKNESKN